MISIWRVGIVIRSGFLEFFGTGFGVADENVIERYMRIGHPDIVAFQHDLIPWCWTWPFLGDGTTAGSSKLVNPQPSAN